MEIIIHARQAQLAEDFKSIVVEKLKSMDRFHVLMERVEVEIIHEANPSQGKNSHRVILTARGAGPLVRAEATAFNDVAAFDNGIANFELQLRKIHEKSKDFDRTTVRKR
ncbi:MAG: HPF/RaiA family ribosome-associated protein [Actinomycetes bacterium]|jgi:ribosomal subunit interface protein|nr:HPF/RaiA family ribosome-associated protein [Actinomycetota bacterium]